MHFLDSQRLLPCLAGLLISVALLWLGSEVFAAARTRSSRVGRMLRAAAIVLGGCGLWWPGHFLEAVDGAGGMALVGGLLALALVGLAGATATAATRKTLPAFTGLAMLTLVVAYGHSVFATPGLFRAAGAAGGWGPGVAVLFLATALVGMSL